MKLYTALKKQLLKDKEIRRAYKKHKAATGTSHFSDFFLHATDEQKQKVITEAAKRANEEQMEVFKKLHLKPEAN